MSSLPTELYEELGSVCRGDVIQRGMPGFQDYATIFNGNVKCLSKAVVCPLDAEDVSRVVVFCAKHGLTLSVKAGGYGTAGWAINGDVIIDLSRITEIDIEPPNSDGTFTSLRQLASAYSKGKSTASSFSSGNSSGSESSSSNSGKRRRNDDAALRRYDLASRAVHTFLQGVDDAQRNSSSRPDGDGPSPSVRRRLETDPNIRPKLYITPSSSNTGVPQQDSGSGSSNSSSAVSRSRSGESNDSRSSSNDSTAATTPSPHSGNNSGSSFGSHSHDSVRRQPRNANPFGYLDEKKTHPPPPSMTTMQSHFPPPSMLRLLGAHQNLPAHAEPVHPCAYVTFGAGARQKEIDTFTARNKLEGRYVGPGTDVGVPYHVPFAAHPVGSSIMLLGGFGFLSRMHGLSIDNLVEVEMVLADGRIVVVSENQYPDLWWAVRGAGPCLGVATRYKARAYPVPVVFAGNLIYRFNRATAPSLIKHFRDCVKGAPRELYANVLLTAGPPGKDSLVVVQMCYVGRKEEGQEYLSAISSWDGEQCLLNEVDEKSFLHQQDSVAQVLRGKAGRQWFIRSALISSLPDDIINQTVMQFADTPVGCTWLFELAGGAVADFEDTCVPKSQREAQFTIAALHQWEMNFDDPRCVESAEEWIAETLKPVHTGGAFPSFLGRHEAADRAKACFGNNWERLKEVKQMYDPTNVFRNTFWPLDASGECVDPRTHEPPTP